MSLTSKFNKKYKLNRKTIQKKREGKSSSKNSQLIDLAAATKKTYTNSLTKIRFDIDKTNQKLIIITITPI